MTQRKGRIGTLSRRQFGALCGAAAAASATAARAQSKTVTIAIQFGYAYLPVVVAEKQGLFQKHAKAAGQDAAFKIQRVSGAPAINDSLISGGIDIGAYGMPGMLIAAEKTRSSIGIRALSALVAGDNGLYTNKPEIKTIEDFKPTDRIAVTAHNGQQAFLLRMVAEKAFGPQNVKHFDTMMVQLPHPDASAAMISGSNALTAYACPHPYSDLMERQSNVRRLFYFADYLGERGTSAVLAATNKFVTENPALATAVVRAIEEANTYIRQNSRKAGEIFLESEKSVLSLDDIEAMLKSVDAEWGVQPTGAMTLAKFMARTGQLKAAPERWQDVFFAPVSDGAGS